MSGIHSNNDRRAVVLMSVLVCMAVAMVLFLAWLKTAAMERRQLIAQQDRVQAELLADAGLDRAAAQLQSTSDYSGEIWQIGAETFAGRGAATVTIRSSPRKRMSLRASSKPLPSIPPVRLRACDEANKLLSSCQTLERRHETRIPWWIYLGRAVGRDCHHRRAGGGNGARGSGQP